MLIWLTALSAPGLAGAAGLDQFIGFGDSTMDSGYFRYQTDGRQVCSAAPDRGDRQEDSRTVAAGGSGAFVGPGVVDTSPLAAKFGLSAMPITIAGGAGTNYANGSAQTVSTTADDGYPHGLYNNVPIVAQISNYIDAVQARQSQRPLHGQLRRQRPDVAANQAPSTLSPQTYHAVVGNSLTTGVAPCRRPARAPSSCSMSMPMQGWSDRAAP